MFRFLIFRFMLSSKFDEVFAFKATTKFRFTESSSGAFYIVCAQNLNNIQITRTGHLSAPPFLTCTINYPCGLHFSFPAGEKLKSPEALIKCYRILYEFHRVLACRG